MKTACLAACILFAVVYPGGRAMAVEEAVYTVEKKDGDFEVRQYEPQVLAETVVDGSMEEAGNAAFRTLFRYISGGNRQKREIAMTAPVGQEKPGVAIPMTAPVGQTVVSNRWAISFMMPAGSKLATLPEPVDANVKLREVPKRRMAAVCYSGTWSQKRYEKQLALLKQWMAAQGLKADGEPVWARYNPPFTLWFLRRNEILIPVGGE